jgi:hypothetical protein
MNLGVAQEEGKQSVVNLDVQIENLNDSPVRFTQFLYTAVVKEDVEPGETILQVFAR